jgi:hypothetical protein
MPGKAGSNALCVFTYRPPNRSRNAFLKFRTRLHPLSIQATDEKLQDLYAQFEDEDLVLAESGLEEYVAILALEDEA